MTPARQPQQKIRDDKIYQITGAEIKAIAYGGNQNEGLKEKLAALKLVTKRVAPHTSPPAPARTVEHMQSAYAHGRMDGAKAAREQVLEETRIEIESQLDDKDRYWKGMMKAIKIIKSLRAQQQGGVSE